MRPEYIAERCRLSEMMRCVSLVVRVIWQLTCGVDIAWVSMENGSGSASPGCSSSTDKSTRTRQESIQVVVAFFAVSVVSISLLGFKSPMPVLYTLIFLAGATVIGTQILLYAAAAQFYGLSIRSTGLGWASGIGRNGAIVGPLLGGALMAINLPLQLNFIAFAVPGAIAALAMAVFTLSGQRRQAATAALAAAKA